MGEGGDGRRSAEAEEKEMEEESFIVLCEEGKDGIGRYRMSKRIGMLP